MQLAAVGAGLVYLLWPTTIVTPLDSGQGIESILLRQLVAVDSAQNCFPSLHIALTMLAVWAIAKSRRHWMTLVFILWGATIAFSILQLKRHLFIDLAGGVVLALSAGMLVSWIMSRQKEGLMSELVIPVILMLLLVLGEALLLRVNSQQTVDWHEVIFNLNSGHIMLWLFRGLEVVCYSAVVSHFSLNLFAEISPIWVWCFAILAWDFGFYWLHRLHHQLAVLWAVHVVHHQGITTICRWGA